MTTYEEMRAAWVDDRDPLRSACQHEWAVTMGGPAEYRSPRVRCLRCEKRPHCAPSIFDSRQRLRSTHAQGESISVAMGKARLCYALSHGRDQAEPYQCRHCGFWSISDVKGERIEDDLIERAVAAGMAAS